MKTITVPDTGDTFTVRARTEHVTMIDVYDAGMQPVAVVGVYSDGSTQIEWSNGGAAYRNRDDQWWDDLRAAAVKAVAA